MGEAILRCRWCREAIGAFEPMIVVAEADARETSVLIERAQSGAGLVGDCYHRICFQERQARS
jgi:hypothetical protein